MGVYLFTSQTRKTVNYHAPSSGSFHLLTNFSHQLQTYLLNYTTLLLPRILVSQTPSAIYSHSSLLSLKSSRLQLTNILISYLHMLLHNISFYRIYKRILSLRSLLYHLSERRMHTNKNGYLNIWLSRTFNQTLHPYNHVLTLQLNASQMVECYLFPIYRIFPVTAFLPAVKNHPCLLMTHVWTTNNTSISHFPTPIHVSWKHMITIPSHNCHTHHDLIFSHLLLLSPRRHTLRSLCSVHTRKGWRGHLCTHLRKSIHKHLHLSPLTTQTTSSISHSPHSIRL